MSNRRKTVGATLMAFVFAAGVVAAQPHGPRHGGGPGQGPGLEMMADHLDLTEQQKVQVKAIFEESKKTADPVQAQLKQGHDAVAAAVKANKSDAELDRLTSAQGALMGQLAGIHAKAFAKVYNLLTPEQKEKADRLHGRMQGMMMQRFDH